MVCPNRITEALVSYTRSLQNNNTCTHNTFQYTLAQHHTSKHTGTNKHKDSEGTSQSTGLGWHCSAKINAIVKTWSYTLTNAHTQEHTHTHIHTFKDTDIHIKTHDQLWLIMMSIKFINLSSSNHFLVSKETTPTHASHNLIHHTQNHGM